MKNEENKENKENKETRVVQILKVMGDGGKEEKVVAKIADIASKALLNKLEYKGKNVTKKQSINARRVELEKAFDSLDNELSKDNPNWELVHEMASSLRKNKPIINGENEATDIFINYVVKKRILQELIKNPEADIKKAVEIFPAETRKKDEKILKQSAESIRDGRDFSISRDFSKNQFDSTNMAIYEVHRELNDARKSEYSNLISKQNFTEEEKKNFDLLKRKYGNGALSHTSTTLSYDDKIPFSRELVKEATFDILLVSAILLTKLFSCWHKALIVGVLGGGIKFVKEYNSKAEVPKKKVEENMDKRLQKLSNWEEVQLSKVEEKPAISKKISLSLTKVFSSARNLLKKANSNETSVVTSPAQQNSVAKHNRSNSNVLGK